MNALNHPSAQAPSSKDYTNLKLGQWSLELPLEVSFS
jgi:hypothetical protein